MQGRKIIDKATEKILNIHKSQSTPYHIFFCFKRDLEDITLFCLGQEEEH
jgi:hypothetical protein